MRFSLLSIAFSTPVRAPIIGWCAILKPHSLFVNIFGNQISEKRARVQTFDLIQPRISTNFRCFSFPFGQFSLRFEPFGRWKSYLQASAPLFGNFLSLRSRHNNLFRFPRLLRFCTAQCLRVYPIYSLVTSFSGFCL